MGVAENVEGESSAAGVADTTGIDSLVMLIDDFFGLGGECRWGGCFGNRRDWRGIGGSGRTTS